ncbi:hypothetical protein OH491_19635 [Termitidicoccus mucosus]|uniref:hypothetical protein n=1 Tax=Termitidicoccus mucosus TaxID=1184151 RepID=UPI003183EB7F
MTDKVSVSLTRLSIAAANEFSSALNAVEDWLQEIRYPGIILSKLDKSGLFQNLPNPALDLLDSIIGEPSWRDSLDLRNCLNAITKKSPDLDKDTRYQRLKKYAY